jgi:hypothetical protein
LQELQSPDTTTQVLRLVKEREIGHLCYLAEEDLSLTELPLLKDLLDISSSAWKIYKHAYCENVQKWIKSNYSVD